MQTLRLAVVLLAVLALAAASDSDSDKKLKKLEKEVKKLEKEIKKAKDKEKEKKKVKKVKSHHTSDRDDDKLYCYCGDKMSEQYSRCDTFYDEGRYTCFKLVNGNVTVRRGAMNADRCKSADAIAELVKDNLVPIKGKENDVHLHCCRRDYCNAAPAQRGGPLALAAGLPLAFWLVSTGHTYFWN